MNHNNPGSMRPDQLHVFAPAPGQQQQQQQQPEVFRLNTNVQQRPTAQTFLPRTPTTPSQQQSINNRPTEITGIAQV